MTGAVFSLRELSTDLKNTDFYFSNLGKITAFRGKILHKYRIQYLRIVISFFFLRFTIFEIIFMFRSETRILKE